MAQNNIYRLTIQDFRPRKSSLPRHTNLKTIPLTCRTLLKNIVAYDFKQVRVLISCFNTESCFFTLKDQKVKRDRRTYLQPRRSSIFFLRNCLMMSLVGASKFLCSNLGSSLMMRLCTSSFSSFSFLASGPLNGV